MAGHFFFAAFRAALAARFAALRARRAALFALMRALCAASAASCSGVDGQTLLTGNGGCACPLRPAKWLTHR